MPVGGALAGEACARSAVFNRALGFQFVLNCLGFPANLTGARNERATRDRQRRCPHAFPSRFLFSFGIPIAPKIPIELWDSMGSRGRLRVTLNHWLQPIRQAPIR